MEKIIGIEKHAGKVRKYCGFCFKDYKRELWELQIIFVCLSSFDRLLALFWCFCLQSIWLRDQKYQTIKITPGSSSPDLSRQILWFLFQRVSKGTLRIANFCLFILIWQIISFVLTLLSAKGSKVKNSQKVLGFHWISKLMNVITVYELFNFLVLKFNRQWFRSIFWRYDKEQEIFWEFATFLWFPENHCWFFEAVFQFRISS